MFVYLMKYYTCRIHFLPRGVSGRSSSIRTSGFEFNLHSILLLDSSTSRAALES